MTLSSRSQNIIILQILKTSFIEIVLSNTKNQMPQKGKIPIFIDKRNSSQRDILHVTTYLFFYKGMTPLFNRHWRILKSLYWHIDIFAVFLLCGHLYEIRMMHFLQKFLSEEGRF